MSGRILLIILFLTTVVLADQTENDVKNNSTTDYSKVHSNTSYSQSKFI